MPDSLITDSDSGDEGGIGKSPIESELTEPTKQATRWKPLRILFVIFARFVTATGNILLSIVITKFAGLDAFGVFAVLTSGCMFATIVAKGGLGVAFLRAGSRMHLRHCLLYTSPSPRDGLLSRMPSSA